MPRAIFMACVSPMVAALGCVSPGGIAGKGTDRFKRCLTANKNESPCDTRVISIGLCPCVCVCVNIVLIFLIVLLCGDSAFGNARENPAHPHSSSLQEPP